VVAGILSFIANYGGMITETAKRKEVRAENNFSLREAH